MSHEEEVSRETENDINDHLESEDVNSVTSNTKEETNGITTNDDDDYDKDDHTVGDTTFETTYDDELNNEDTGDYDEDDDEPPKLKYSRLNKLPPNFFTRDPVSSSNFYETHFIFGTHSGIIHICDTGFKQLRTFKAHRASILSIYTDGSFFATASMDGTVVIGSISDEKDIIAYDFKRPVHAIVLDKNYYKTRSFVSGGMNGKVLYSSKNWLGQRTDITLDEDNGPVVCIQSIDDLVLWMNDKGITIFHTITRQVVKTIERPEDSPRSDLYWPRVHMLEIDRILVGWANYIWSLRISLRSSDDKSDSNASSSNKSRILPSAASISFRTVQEKKVQIEHVYKLDSLIAGISSFKDDYWMVLTYEPPNQNGESFEFNNPDLKLINSITGEVDFEEEIGMKNIEGLGLNDYSLNRHIGLDNTLYFIVSAKDGIIAEEVKLDDRLNWFVDKERYKDAWEISEHLVSPTKRLNFGIMHVDNLVKVNMWYDAANFLKRVLELDENKLTDSDTKSTTITSSTKNGTNDDGYDDEYIKNVIYQWENWAMILIKSSHIELLTDIIPLSPKLSLPTSIYDEILQFWIHKNMNKFFELIDRWDFELYDIKTIQGLMEQFLETNENNDNLRRCLVDLYAKTFEPYKAVSHLIKLKDPNLVQFLSNNHLLSNFINELPTAIKFRFPDNDFNSISLDKITSRLKDIIEMLVDKRHEILPGTIVELMKNNHLGFINYLYLEKLQEIDEFLTQEFANEIVELYSSYNRQNLLPFLMKNSDYNIDKAINLCENNEFYEELVYLLGKIGENREALMLIINKLDDPDIAINFAKHQNDTEAWNILLDYSMAKPAFIKALIEGADDQSSQFYDPISVIKRIPNDVKIEGLKDSVKKISENNDLNLLLNQIILKLIYNRSENISKTFRSELLRGLEVNVKDKQVTDLIKQFETILVYNDGVQSLNSRPKFMKESEINTHSPKKVYSTLESKLNHLEMLDENFHY